MSWLSWREGAARGEKVIVPAAHPYLSHLKIVACRGAMRQGCERYPWPSEESTAAQPCRATRSFMASCSTPWSVIDNFQLDRSLSVTINIRTTCPQTMTSGRFMEVTHLRRQAWSNLAAASMTMGKQRRSASQRPEWSAKRSDAGNKIECVQLQMRARR